MCWSFNKHPKEFGGDSDYVFSYLVKKFHDKYLYERRMVGSVE